MMPISYSSLSGGIVLVSLLILGACDSRPATTKVPDGATLALPGEGPADAREGACYGKDMTPAVIDTVTESKQVSPAVFAPDGATIITPPTYETVTNQVIVGGGELYYFEVPCEEVLTPEFIASVQRALSARGAYAGQITGVLDAKTRAAIRQFQLPEFNSDILTMETAQILGLTAYGGSQH